MTPRIVLALCIHWSTWKLHEIRIRLVCFSRYLIRCQYVFFSSLRLDNINYTNTHPPTINYWPITFCFLALPNIMVVCGVDHDDDDIFIINMRCVLPVACFLILSICFCARISTKENSFLFRTIYLLSWCLCCYCCCLWTRRSSSLSLSALFQRFCILCIDTSARSKNL